MHQRFICQTLESLREQGLLLEAPILSYSDHRSFMVRLARGYSASSGFPALFRTSSKSFSHCSPRLLAFHLSRRAVYGAAPSTCASCDKESHDCSEILLLPDCRVRNHYSGDPPLFAKLRSSRLNALQMELFESTLSIATHLRPRQLQLRLLGEKEDRHDVGNRAREQCDSRGTLCSIFFLCLLFSAV